MCLLGQLERLGARQVGQGNLESDGETESAAVRQAKANIADSAVGARVGIGPTDSGGFGLAVTLEVSLPHLPRAEALELTEKAHQVCPYSNATRGNIDVTLEVTED